MIYQKLRKVGNSYVVTIPKEEIERQALKEGQLLAIQVQPVLSGEMRDLAEESWQANKEGYRYLAGR